MARTWPYAPMFADVTVPYTNRTHRVLRPPWSRALIQGCQRCEYVFAGLHCVTNETTAPSIPSSTKKASASTASSTRSPAPSPAAAWARGPRTRVANGWNDGLITRYMGYGWILISTGMLRRLNSDAEIAFVLAHEVAHVIARHSSEGVGVFHKLIPSFVKTHLCRRQELEADYIAVMLLAESRFDPRAALQALDKIGTMTTTTTQKSSFFSQSTRPSWQ